MRDFREVFEFQESRQRDPHSRHDKRRRSLANAEMEINFLASRFRFFARFSIFFVSILYFLFHFMFGKPGKFASQANLPQLKQGQKLNISSLVGFVLHQSRKVDITLEFWHISFHCCPDAERALATLTKVIFSGDEKFVVIKILTHHIFLQSSSLIRLLLFFFCLALARETFTIIVKTESSSPLVER